MLETGADAGEKVRLLDSPTSTSSSVFYMGTDNSATRGVNVLQLRSWIDDPYEQVQELPSERYSTGGKMTAVKIEPLDNKGSLSRQAKVAILSCLMFLSLVVSMFFMEEAKDAYLVTPCHYNQRVIFIEDITFCDRIAVSITGNIDNRIYSEPQNNSIRIGVRLNMGKKSKMVESASNITADSAIYITQTSVRSVKFSEMTNVDHTFFIPTLKHVNSMSLVMWPEGETCSSIHLSYQCRSVIQDYKVVVAVMLLLVVYGFIMTEIIHRVSAALLGASLGIAALSILNMRPQLMQIILWIDWETIALLMGMMVMVSVLADSGFFDWTAVKVYELSRGRIWVLVSLLSFITALLSAFLDNVTTILLITPVTVTLCQVMHLDPKKVILTLVMFSNIGGASTGIGDPPNVLIINSPDIKKEISFSEFTLHMFIGAMFAMLGTYAFIWMVYKRKEDSLIVQNTHTEELIRESELWKRIAERTYMGNSEEVTVREMLSAKACQVRQLATEKTVTSKTSSVTFAINLPKLRARYRIRDKSKMIKTGCVLLGCILLFFIYSVPSIHTAPGEIAMAGAITLIILIDHHDMEGLLHNVEWATLMFFAGLFILVECLSHLGLISTIGNLAAEAIKAIDDKYQLMAAISIILWLSAIISAFIDNIPFTASIIPVLNQISVDTGLPLPPLVYALAFGACLGGNGTLIGASANVVAVGIAEEKGYKISFWEFAKLGIPVMIISVFISHIYLLVCHCLFEWGN